MNDERKPGDLARVFTEAINLVAASEKIQALVPLLQAVAAQLTAIAIQDSDLLPELIAANNDLDALLKRLGAMEAVLVAKLTNLRDEFDLDE